MNCTESRHDTKTLMDQQLDPKKILGIVILGNAVHLQTLDIPARIAEKMRMTIPVIRIPTGAVPTVIKSIQLKNRLVVAEITGPMTALAKNVIDVIATQLAKIDMVTAFFPGGTADKAPTQYYFGFDMDALRPASPHVKNVRLLDDGQGLIFTQGNQLKRLNLSQINEKWAKVAVVLYEPKKEISFLGRIQKNEVAVTLSDETTFSAKLAKTTASVTILSDFRQKVTAVLGTLQQKGTTLIAGIKGRELILVPTAVNQ